MSFARPTAIALSPRPPFLRGKGERMVFLKICIPGYSDGFARMDNAMNPKKPLAIPLGRPIAIPPSSQDLSPRPPFLRGKGERMAFLKVCIQGCFDGFERMEHAMKIQKPLHTIPRKTHRHSPFLLGRGPGGRSPSHPPPPSVVGTGPRACPHIRRYRSHRHFTT